MLSLRRRSRINWRKTDRKSTRLNSSHTVIYTLSLHDALPISLRASMDRLAEVTRPLAEVIMNVVVAATLKDKLAENRSEEHTSELQSHRDLHSFPTRRSSDLVASVNGSPRRGDAAARRGDHECCRCGDAQG